MAQKMCASQCCSRRGVSNATRCPFSGHQRQSGCQLSHSSQQVLPLIFCSGTDLVPALGTSHISFTQTAWMLLIQHQHSPCQLWEHLTSHPGDFPCSFCRESKRPSFKMGFADWWGKVMDPLCHTQMPQTLQGQTPTQKPFRSLIPLGFAVPRQTKGTATGLQELREHLTWDF